ncbi:YSC84-related protein [Mangrovicoccus sp. HB161399]|uniref:lipid-binding SYLF domain-containing protein n=1 Tax=Mangrovicoccus sp. HB161399 TaxID=2720392 RepID=UPI0015547DA5|nr:YSC84-related protein [Mangrovicoccus sp. HB161399]
MTNPTRRAVLMGGAALLAACDNSVGANGGAVIDQRVQQTLSYMYANYPETREIAAKSSGMLVMPLIGEAGFIVGGGYGEGALVIGDATVDYYSATQASFGFQIGAQQYAYVMFFLTPEALREFRTSPGWTGGADAEFALDKQGGNLSASTDVSGKPVVAIIFAQTGLRAAATLAGTKYTRILR